MRKQSKALRGAALAALVMIPVLAFGQGTAAVSAALMQKAVEEGSVRLLVRLAVPEIEELTAASNAHGSLDPSIDSPWGGAQADMALMDAIAFAAQGVLLELRGNAYEVKYIYRSIPYMALQASEGALAALQDSPAVLAIEEDLPWKLVEPVAGRGPSTEGSAPATEPDPPLLNGTAALVGATDAWGMGYTGAGRYVAILDTGIRSSHQFFAGKTIVEACYAAGSDGIAPVGDCPNGLVSQTGAGSAVHYSSTYTGWDHGTHVAGIAAGNNGTLFGIAKDANIIAVKVFSMFPAADCGGSSPCVMSWNTDQLAGLDYVYSIRGSYAIDAVNMSLGGGSYNTACDGDSRKAAIDNLRAVGIATVIATGNNGYCGSIGSPSCISTSVAVGSTTDADVRSSFSNWHASMQRLFAPGSSIYSSTGSNDSSYASWSGTSMATPHVTGAWALVKHFRPTATVDEVLEALRQTGVSVTTSCDGYIFGIPRIRIQNAINSLLPPAITVTSPNGGENWNSGTVHNITWTSSGTVGNVSISYSADNGDNWSAVASNVANSGSTPWTVPAIVSNQCLVWVREASDNDPGDVSNRVFSISSAASETVSIPLRPDGQTLVTAGSSYTYATGGASSNLGHDVQYLIDWDDGSTSSWLLVGTTSASHSWAKAGTYKVRAMARCASHTGIESDLSETLFVTVYSDGDAYNAPANRLVIPEVNWSANWASSVQVTDVSGGSTVVAYYSTGATRRGPFTLWVNTTGAAGSSMHFANILQTIDSLDPEAFTYLNTSGTLDLMTRIGDNVIQAAVRTVNSGAGGNSSRTFPALADCATNTAGGGRLLVIPDMSNDATYRPSVALYNPAADAVDVRLVILGSDGAQVGSSIDRTLSGYESAVVTGELRADTYSHAVILVEVTSDDGRVLASGQTANNVSSDPAAHLALQASGSYANSPEQGKLLTEVNWSANWASSVQLVDVSGGSIVSVAYVTGTSVRGPFPLWNNSAGAMGSSTTFANILQTIDGLDASADVYVNTSGGVMFVTQDASHVIQAAVRTVNSGVDGNSSRTFTSLGLHPANSAAVYRPLLIPNLSNDATYRPSVTLLNPTSYAMDIEMRIIGASGAQVGSTITRTLAASSHETITSELRADTYSNATIKINVVSGDGWVLASGQTANNVSNDPAAHVAVQGQ